MSHPHDIRQLSEEQASDAGAPGSVKKMFWKRYKKVKSYVFPSSIGFRNCHV